MERIEKSDFKKALPVCIAQLAREQSSENPDREAIVVTLNRIGVTYVYLKKLDNAERTLEQAAKQASELPLPIRDALLYRSKLNLSILYRAQYKYARAEQLLREILELAEKRPVPNPAEQAHIRTQLAESYMNQGKYADAEPLLQRCLKDAKHDAHPDSPQTADALENLAELYRLKRNYGEAERHLLDSIGVQRKQDRPDDSQLANTLNKLGGVARDMGQYRRAERFFRQSLSLLNGALGPTHSAVSTVQNNLASLRQAEGDNFEAEKLFREVLAQRQARLGSEDEDVAKSLGNLAAVVADNGRYDEAETYLKQAVSIFERTRGKTDPAVASALNNLGVFYQQQGRTQQAEALLERALQMRRAALGEAHPLVATSHTNLATLLVDQRRENSARLHLEAAQRIREKAFGLNHPEVTATLQRLAAQYQRLGQANIVGLYLKQIETLNQQRATPNPETVLSESISIGRLRKKERPRLPDRPLLWARNRLLPRNPLEEPLPVSLSREVADYLEEIGHPDEGIEFLEHNVNALSRRSLLSTKEGIEDVQKLIAFYTRKGTTEKVDELYERTITQLAKRTSRSAGIPAEGEVIATFVEHAFTYAWLRRDFSRAQQLVAQLRGTTTGRQEIVSTVLSRLDAYARGYPKRERDLLKEFSEVSRGSAIAETRSLLATVVRALNEDDQTAAGRYFFESLSLAEHHLRKQVSLTKNTVFLQEIWGMTQLLIGRLSNRKNTSRAVRELAWTALLLQHGRSLDNESQAIRLLRSDIVVTRYKTNLEQIDSNKDEARRSFMRGEYESRDFQISWHMAEQITEGVLDIEYQSHSEPVAEPFDVVRTVSKKLPDDGVLVHFVELPVSVQAASSAQPHAVQYLALLLFPDGRTDVVKLRPNLKAAAEIGDVLIAFADENSKPIKVAKHAYDWLLAPVMAAVGRTKRLYLIPDGALNLIPFDALYHDGKYVLNGNHEIYYLSSGRDLLRAPSSTSAGDDLILGDPDFAQDPEKRGLRTTNRQDAQASSMYELMRNLKALRGARTEAEKVAELLNAEAKVGPRATEELLRQAHSPRVVLLATHGVFLDPLSFSPPDSDENRVGKQALKNPIPLATIPPEPLGPRLKHPMLRSALALVGAHFAEQVADIKEDGILTADEARELNLDGTQLVVLSACQTGKGTVPAGDGVYGLRRAFLMAGAETLVASLWRVSDHATKNLMVDYFSLLNDKHLPRVQALRQAMQNAWTRDPHPHYWAPFIAIGRNERLRN